MKKYVVFCQVGFCGMDAVEALAMPDDHTEDELADAAWEIALSHAEGYGYYPMEAAPEDYDPDAEDYDENVGDNYVDSIEGYAVPYDPEKHDMKRSGGGSFEDDFERYKD